MSCSSHPNKVACWCRSKGHTAKYSRWSDIQAGWLAKLPPSPTTQAPTATISCRLLEKEAVLNSAKYGHSTLLRPWIQASEYRTNLARQRMWLCCPHNVLGFGIVGASCKSNAAITLNMARALWLLDSSLRSAPSVAAQHSENEIELNVQQWVVLNVLSSIQREVLMH